MSRVWVCLLSLLVVACAPVSERSTDTAPETVPPREEQVPAATAPVQWVQFGMVLSVSSVEVEQGDGANEEALDMRILLDSGEALDIVQPVSQAGRLNRGDRVRVLRIGGFSRVTFWPYGNFSPRPEPN
ncbi:hypothetical protein [Motiliproteus sediminis]|uniref:hypothetical protein n=1 Tax=Motiliproteus sediminis TaxID=1468178 RepID=UPI001AEF87FB|nr:hypothetical protein [Motiliproteus sediminis]